MEFFIYARKSTESEDRQVLSIEAQIKELQAVALNQGLKIVEVFSEAKSAKAPGRPIFNKVIERLYQTQDMGILCWKLDRLARNPVDGGQLIWSIEQGTIKQIITPHRRFLNNSDDKFWMQLEFGMAKKYVDDLSDNVKRGLRAKLEKGVLPGRAPIGYLNDRESRLIVKDPERFPLIRRIWDTVLREDYSIEYLLRTTEEDWGLMTRQTKKRGGKPLTQSLLYKLLSNPFYYGAILRKGEIYPGCHEPMVTKDEFDQVQKILGRPTARPLQKEFAYTGLIQCGECGSMITAEEQVIRYKPTDHYNPDLGKRVKGKCLFQVVLDDPLIPDDELHLIGQEIHQDAINPSQPKGAGDDEGVILEEQPSREKVCNNYSTFSKVNKDIIYNNTITRNIKEEQGRVAAFEIDGAQRSPISREKRDQHPKEYEPIYQEICNLLGAESILLQTILNSCVIGDVQSESDHSLIILNAPNRCYKEILESRYLKKMANITDKSAKIFAFRIEIKNKA